MFNGEGIILRIVFMQRIVVRKIVTYLGLILFLSIFSIDALGINRAPQQGLYTNQTHLVISPESKYCSIDPYVLQNGAVFSTKSRLTIAPGNYLITGDNPLADLIISIETPKDVIKLVPKSPPLLLIRRSDIDDALGQPERDRIEIKGPYSSGVLELDKFFLRVSRSKDGLFHLGDPKDITAFYQNNKNILIGLSQHPSAFFPGLMGKTLFFAPCGMEGVEVELFQFDFIDGSSIRLSVGVINGSNELGYYIGRLLSAKGVIHGKEINIQNPNHLAFMGSTRSWSEIAIPTFAVRTGQNKEGCGYVFDASEWDTPEAVDGYRVYKMNCDETIGVEVELKSVAFPDFFVMP